MNILQQATEEQLLIVDALREKNIIVNSVAGSGKTTTILHIAQNHINDNILLLTYNKRLRHETRQRLGNLTNLEVHTFHSFAYGYYGICTNDRELIRIINNCPLNKDIAFTMILIDECQDMNYIYYKFVHKILKDNENCSKFGLIGDVNQMIYKFNEADSRYLSLGDKIFNPNLKKWERLNLTRSFRLTIPMAGFINNCIFGYEKIVTMRDGPKVEYIICNIFHDSIYKRITELLNNYDPSDIFVLAPSIKSRNKWFPISKLANRLSDAGVLMHVPLSDDERLDDSIIENKMVFSTFHQAKGLERKVCIVFNFDTSYFTHYSKGLNANICPNAIYVAITRACEQLILIHHKRNNYFEFIRKEYMDKWCTVHGDIDIEQDENALKKKELFTGVTEFLHHLPTTILNRCMYFIKYETIHPPQKRIYIRSKLTYSNYNEMVAEINGKAIPEYYRCLIIDQPISARDALHWATKECSRVYKFKLNQIKYYNWISNDKMDIIMDRMHQFIPNPTEFEREVARKFRWINIYGYIDILTRKAIWEIKCTSHIRDEHLMQLAIYKYLFHEQLDALLFNVLTGELIQITSSNDDIEQLINIILDHKRIEEKNKTSDKIFTDNCHDPDYMINQFQRGEIDNQDPCISEQLSCEESNDY